MHLPLAHLQTIHVTALSLPRPNPVHHPNLGATLTLCGPFQARFRHPRIEFGVPSWLGALGQDISQRRAARRNDDPQRRHEPCLVSLVPKQLALGLSKG